MTRTTFSDKVQLARQLAEHIDIIDAELRLKCAEISLLKMKRELMLRTLRQTVGKI